MMLRAIVLLSIVLGVALAVPLSSLLDAEWEEFKSAHGKMYATAQEENLRRVTWEDNLRYIQQHNLEADRGVHTFWLGTNKYADMGIAEFVKTMNGFRMNASAAPCGQYMVPSNVDLEDLPDTVDWRPKGFVTPVKDQGQCGSCWAFSTTGSLEGQHFRKTGKLVSLSEKNLMDCSQAFGNNGCKGGLMDQAFAYIIHNKGVDTEDSYPYQPIDGQCRFSAQNIGATEVSCMDIESMNEDNLQKAVAMEGPVSVAIDANHRSFQLYKSGIYMEPLCSPTALDHGVLAIGYGTDSGQDYWLVKNSWGTSWGNMGFIQMARNNNNMCGIATLASFPTV